MLPGKILSTYLEERWRPGGPPAWSAARLQALRPWQGRGLRGPLTSRPCLSVPTPYEDPSGFGDHSCLLRRLPGGACLFPHRDCLPRPAFGCGCVLNPCMAPTVGWPWGGSGGTGRRWVQPGEVTALLGAGSPWPLRRHACG